MRTEKLIYVFDDFTDPGKSCSVDSLAQLTEKTGMSERTLGRKFKHGNVYVEPHGLYKIMRLIFTPNKRIFNGNTDNFKKKEE